MKLKGKLKKLNPLKNVKNIFTKSSKPNHSPTLNYEKIHKKLRRMIENNNLDEKFLEDLMKNEHDELKAALNRIIEEKWLSKKWEERKDSVHLIEFFYLTEHLDKLIILSLNGNSNVNIPARQFFYRLMNQSVEDWLKDKKNKSRAKKAASEYVKKLWDHEDWTERRSIVYIIGVFKLKEHLDKLAVLNFDISSLVNNQAKQFFRRLTNQSVEDWLKDKNNFRKAKKAASEFVRKFWSYPIIFRSRHISAVVQPFSLEEHLDKLAVLCFDADHEGKVMARRSFLELTNQSVEDWLKDEKNLEKAKKAASEYVKILWNQGRMEEETIISVITHFNLKEQADKLLALTFDKNEEIRNQARESFNKFFSSPEQFKKYLDELSNEGRQRIIKNLREDKNTIKGLSEECSPILLLVLP